MSMQWPLILLGLIAGTGGGLLAFAGLGQFTGASKKARFIASIVAIVLLIVGGICSVLHLGHPTNVMAAIAHLTSFSGISLELIFLGLAVVCAIAFALCLARGSESGAKVCAILGIILGVVLDFVLGHGYVIEARALWNTNLLPLAFLFSGLTAGGFLFVEFARAFKDEGAEASADGAKLLGRVLLVVCAIELVVFVIYGIVVGFALANVTAYWAVSVIVGGIVPLVCGYMTLARDKGASWLHIAVVCALIGCVTIRMMMFASGTPFIDAIDEAVANRGLYLL